MIEELELFTSLKDIKVVFDVGARTDLEYIKLKPDIEIHYFEPHQEFADQLKGIVNRFGLSDMEGETLYYPITQSFEVKDGKGIMYPLKTLDWYAEDIPRIDFLKIDAEGMDYKILLGGKETLKKVRYLQFEFGKMQKFVDLLSDFDLFLIKESRLFSIIPLEVRAKYDQLLTKLDEEVIKLIDNYFIPRGAGGNILGVRK